MEKLLVMTIFVVLMVGCGTAATPTPTVRSIPIYTLAPVPTSTLKPTPTLKPERVQIGVWNDSPSPFWIEATITMYRNVAGGKLTLETRYSDGSSRIQELIQSATQPTRYDIVGDEHGEYYLLQDGVLAASDPDGLIWEATKK